MIIDNWTDVSLTKPNFWAGPEFPDFYIFDRKKTNINLGPDGTDVGLTNLASNICKIQILPNNDVLLSRKEEYSYPFVEIERITHSDFIDGTWPSLAFDQLGRPVFTWMVGNLPWLYWYNPLTGANETRSFPQVHAGSTITSVTIAIDYPYADGAVTRNLRMFFMNTEGRVFTAKQSDRYDIIEDTGYSFPAGTFLVGGGLRKDNSFGLRVCKVTRMGV